MLNPGKHIQDMVGSRWKNPHICFGSSQGSFGQEMPLEVTIRVRSGNKTSEGNPGREKHIYKEIQAKKT